MTYYPSQVAFCKGSQHVPPHYTVYPHELAQRQEIHVGQKMKCPGCGERVATEPWNAAAGLRILKEGCLPAEEARRRFADLLEMVRAIDRRK